MNPTFEDTFAGTVWDTTTGTAPSPHLTPQARAAFKTQALHLANHALAQQLPDGTQTGWVNINDLINQLFTSNKAYGAALVTTWMTTHNIPTSEQEKNLKLTREALKAAFTGNTNYGTVSGKPKAAGIARHVYGLTQKASINEEKLTQGRVQYQVFTHGVTELKNTLDPGVEAKVTDVVQLARKAILTNQGVTITDVSMPFRSGTTASQPGVVTGPTTEVRQRMRGLLESARLSYTKEDEKYARPGMEWSGIIHDTLTAASKHLDTHPNTDDATLIGAATSQIVADTGLTDPADPAAATHLTALLTGALEGAGLTTPALTNHPHANIHPQFNAVLTHAKQHGPLTDQTIIDLALAQWTLHATPTTDPSDLAAFTWQVRGWLHGAGLHGAPHPEQPPHPLATRAAQLADQLTARNLPYTPAQIAASLFPHLPAVTDHHRDLTATWIDQYTQSHTPPTNTTPSTLDTTGRQIPVRANKITWKRDQPDTPTAAVATTSGTSTSGTGLTGTTTGTTAPTIPPWPTAATPNINLVTGLTPAQQAALTQLALQTTPALPGASTDTFYTALLTATPEQLRNATTPGQIRQHLATQAILDFHTDPTIATRITHAGGLDTVLTHLHDGTDATTATGALVPDLAARHYEFPIDIIDANGDLMPGAGRPRQVTANTVNSTTIALTHTRQPQNTTGGASGATGGSYDHFLPTTADDHLNVFLAPDSSSTGRNRRRREESREPSEERDRRGWAPRTGGWSDTLFGSVPVVDTTASPAAGKNPVQTAILNENTPTPARTSPTISTPATTTPTNDAADGDPHGSSIRDALAGPTTPATTATTPATTDTTPATTATSPATTPTVTSPTASAAGLGVGVVAADTPDAALHVEQQFPWLKTVNPYYKSGTRYTRAEFETNCVLAAITVDISIAEGEGFTTPPSAAATIDELINNTGNRPVPTTYRDIAAHLLNSPPGTRGYLTIETAPGTGQRTIDGQTVDGHVINVIHAVDGNVYFLDGQTGGPAQLPDNPTKVEYIPTTTTDTLASPLPSQLSRATDPIPGKTLSTTAGLGNDADTAETRPGTGKAAAGIDDLTADDLGDDEFDEAEAQETSQLTQRLQDTLGRHVNATELLTSASTLLTRLPMVIPDRSPELTAAYAAIQDTKFQVAKLLHAGNHTGAQAEAERLTAEFTRNHPEAFIPGVTTIRARGGVREVITHEPARFTDQTWTPVAGQQPGVQVWAANHELTHQALVAFQDEALRIARADAAHQTNGIRQHWADPVAVAKKLFSTNTGYGVQLVRGWLTNAGIPTSKTQYLIGQVNLLAGPNSPAVNAAAVGNTTHPHVYGDWLHHQNITAAIHGRAPTRNERDFVSGWSEAIHQKNPLNGVPLNATPDGATRQAEIHRAQALAWKALITGTPLSLESITDEAKNLGITQAPGTGNRTKTLTNLVDRAKGWLAAVGLYPTGSSVNQVWSSGRTLLTEDIITRAHRILAEQPASSIMGLTPALLSGQIAAAILAHPPGITTPIVLDTNPDGSSPDRANFEVFITAVLQSSSTQPLTDPGTVADLTHVLNQAWAHPGEITERDVKTFAINRFGDDSPAILHTVNGWLYGAGVLGDPPAPGAPRHTRIYHAATNAAATTVTGATPAYTAATHQIHPNPAPYTVAVTTTAVQANWPPITTTTATTTAASASTATVGTGTSTAATTGTNPGGAVGPTVESRFGGAVWNHPTGMSSTPSLTPRARAWFKTQALQLANDALARPRPDGTVPGWVEVDALTDQLFSSNKAYGTALVTVWMTTHNIPTSGPEKHLKLTREAINAAFTGNTNYGTKGGKPQPTAIARYIYGLTRDAHADEEKRTQGRVRYQVVAHGVTALKNMLQPGVEAKVNDVIRLARKAVLTNQKVTLADVSGPFTSAPTTSQSGASTGPAPDVVQRVRGVLESGRLYHTKEDERYARPGMEWSGIIHDTITAASKHLDTNPTSDDAALITAATAQIIADTGLTDPADPAAATHLTALLTGALEGAGLATPTLANHPNSYLGAQLNAVLTYAKDHGPLTDQDIKVLAQQELGTVTSTVTTPADYALFVWQVRGWLHGAGLHGAPHPEQPPHPLATRAAYLADQLTARNLPYTPAQIAAGLFPHLTAVTDHHRDLTATWIDQYTQSHTPPTNTAPSTLDTTGRQITARATLTTWKRDQPQSTTSAATATAASTATASTSSTATTGAIGVTAGAVGMPASNIPPWPSAVTPDIDPVTGLTPDQQAALTQWSLQTTPALPGASTDTFYTALLTATPEQLRNATTPGEIRQHLATQAVLDFHTDPAMAARITHAGGLDTVLTHLRDGTEATTGTGALVPDLTARHYEFPIDIIDANGDLMPGAGRPRQVTANTVNSTTVTLTHTHQPQNTNTTGASDSADTGTGTHDHFLPTTANDHLNAFLAPNSNNPGRNTTRKRDASRDPSRERDRRGWAPRNDGWSDTLFGSVPVADTTASPAAGKNPVQTTILNENTPTPARTSPTISTPAVTTPTNDAADGDPHGSSIRDALAGPTTPATTATTPATFDTTPATTATSPATTPTVTSPTASAAGLGVGVVAAATPDAALRVGQRFPWLKTVNPFYKSGTRYTRAEFETNCVLAAITVDISIAEGEGFTTPPSAATTIDELINNTGNRPVPTTYRDIAAHLLNSPPGTRGYLTIETAPGTGQHTIDSHAIDGHVINVIHAVDGNVYFLDGQTGGPAHLPDNPTKVEYIPTTTTDTLATPATTTTEFNTTAVDTATTLAGTNNTTPPESSSSVPTATSSAATASGAYQHRPSDPNQPASAQTGERRMHESDSETETQDDPVRRRVSHREQDAASTSTTLTTTTQNMDTTTPKPQTITHECLICLEDVKNPTRSSRITATCSHYVGEVMHEECAIDLTTCPMCRADYKPITFADRQGLKFNSHYGNDPAKVTTVLSNLGRGIQRQLNNAGGIQLDNLTRATFPKSTIRLGHERHFTAYLLSLTGNTDLKPFNHGRALHENTQWQFIQTQHAHTISSLQESNPRALNAQISAIAQSLSGYADAPNATAQKVRRMLEYGGYLTPIIGGDPTPNFITMVLDEGDRRINQQRRGLLFNPNNQISDMAILSTLQIQPTIEADIDYAFQLSGHYAAQAQLRAHATERIIKEARVLLTQSGGRPLNIQDLLTITSAYTSPAITIEALRNPENTEYVAFTQGVLEGFGLLPLTGPDAPTSTPPWPTPEQPGPKTTHPTNGRSPAGYSA